jgi:hypothetical protein
MSRAFRCEICDKTPHWRLDRRGDAVVSWACNDDLAEVCRRLQRHFEVTELVVRDWARLRAEVTA